VVDHAVVKVLTAKMGVTSSGLDLKDTLVDGQDRHIKGTAAEVKDEDVLLACALELLVQTICNGGSGPEKFEK